MKISKPIQYLIVIGGILAIALILWNVYSNSQEESTPEVASSPVPVKPKPSKAATAAKTSPTPATAAKVAQAPTAPTAKASTAPTAKSSATPAAAKASTVPTTTTTKAVPPGTLEFRNAVNKAMAAAELTQTAKTKAQWSTISNDWQQAISFMKAVPQTHPKYQIAQQKAVEYQSKLNYSKEASTLAQ